MTDEPVVKPPVQTEIIPAVSGHVSAIGSAGAPFVYFEGASYYGLLNGIGRITLEAERLCAGTDGMITTDKVFVAHLRGNLPAIRSLRAALGLGADFARLLKRDDGIDPLGRYAEINGELDVVRSE